MSKLQGIESILPKSLDYKQMKKSMVRGTRKTMKLLPDSAPEYWAYDNNNKITFSIPANGGFLDMENTVICFEAQAYNGGATTLLRFNNHIESIINKVEWKTGNGSDSVELLQNYNLNAVSDYKYETNDNYNPVARLQQGIGTTAERIAMAQVKQGYSINLMGSGLMHSTMQYLPLSLLAQDGYSRSLVLELTIENPEYCMSRTNNTQAKGYRVYNAFMMLELVDCPEYEKELTRKVKSGELVFGIPYISQQSWTNIIESGRRGEITFQTNIYNNIVQGFRTVFKKSDDNNTTDEYTDLYRKPFSITNYQLTIGNRFFPQQPLIITAYNNATWVNELLKYYNKTKNLLYGIRREVAETNIPTTNPATNNLSLDNNFVLCTTFKTFYDSEKYLTDNHEYFLDGIDTTQTNQIVLKFNLDTAPSVAFNLFHFIDYVGVLAISKDGVQILK